MITEQDIEHWFTYRVPEQEDAPKLLAIRDAGKAFALTVLRNTTPSADQTTAIRKIREAVMTANAGIVLRGK
ncbi:MAG: DUF7681 family protein [Steroidobacteraceae bacterium]